MISEGSQSQSSDTKQLETTEHAKDLKDQNLHIFIGVRSSNLDEAKYDAWSVCTSSHIYLQSRRKRTPETKEERWRRGWMDAMHIPSPSTQQELWQCYPRSPTHWLLMWRLVQWQLPLWSCFHRVLAPPAQHLDAATDSSVLHLVSTNPETLPPQPCSFFGFCLSALQDFSSTVFPQKATIFHSALQVFLQSFFQNLEFAFSSSLDFSSRAFSKTNSFEFSSSSRFSSRLFQNLQFCIQLFFKLFFKALFKPLQKLSMPTAHLMIPQTSQETDLQQQQQSLSPSLKTGHHPHTLGTEAATSNQALSLSLSPSKFKDWCICFCCFFFHAGIQDLLPDWKKQKQMHQSPNSPKQAYLETPLRTRLSDKAFLSSTHTQTWELCSWVALFRGIPE